MRIGSGTWGIAREISVLQGSEFTMPSPEIAEPPSRRTP